MSAGRSHLGRLRLAKPAIAMVLFGSAGRNGYSVLANGTSPGIRSPVVAVVVVGVSRFRWTDVRLRFD